MTTNGDDGGGEPTLEGMVQSLAESQQALAEQQQDMMERQDRIMERLAEQEGFADEFSEQFADEFAEQFADEFADEFREYLPNTAEHPGDDDEGESSGRMFQ